jgi:hypothetical protein
MLITNKAIVLSNNYNSAILSSQLTIQVVESIKRFGVTFHHKLNFNKHTFRTRISNVSQMINRKVFGIKRLFQFSVNFLVCLGNSFLVLSVF